MKEILKYTKKTTLLSALITLSACATVAPDTAKTTSLILPEVIKYDSAFQDRLIDEALSGACDAHVEFGTDYILTRDRIRNSRDKLV